MKVEQRALYEERTGLWKRLADDGLTRTELAALAGIAPGMVKYAMRTDRRRESATPGG